MFEIAQVQHGDSRESQYQSRTRTHMQTTQREVRKEKTSSISHMMSVGFALSTSFLAVDFKTIRLYD